MNTRWVAAAVVAGGAVAAADMPWAQQAPAGQPSIVQEEPAATSRPAKPPRGSRVQQPQLPTSQLQPDLDPADQLAPSQIQQPLPSAVPAPGQPARRPTKERAQADRPAPGARSVACKGAFGKDSSHLKLAIAFDSRNIAFTEVDGGPVGKVQASVLFPNDAKRRLEVWWNNPASRTDTYLIVINGQSNWMAPKSVRLGLPLVALEKLNKKPFKLKGLKDNIATVSDWQGGALASLPGGCKIGVSMTADAKATDDARKAASDNKEYESSDEAIRAVKPTVSEIIIGY
jgi:hypothetical protein